MTRYFYLLILLFILEGLSVLSYGATLEWDRNTEADMRDYEVYTCTPNPTCTVQQLPANRIGVVPQVAMGTVPSFVIPAGIEGKIAVSASDLSGNKSGLSVSLPFDAKAPLVPVNPRVAP